MGGSDVRADSVERDQLLLERGKRGVPGRLARRGGDEVFQGQIPSYRGQDC